MCFCINGYPISSLLIRYCGVILTKCNRRTNAGVFVLFLKTAYYSIKSRYILNDESFIFKDFTKESEATIINSNHLF